MKKLFTSALIAFAFSCYSQNTLSVVPLTPDQTVFISRLKIVDDLKSFTFPEKLTDVFDKGIKIRQEYQSDNATKFVFMPDAELRIERHLNNGYYTDIVYYLRLVKNTVIGYSLGYQPNGNVKYQVVKGASADFFNFTLKN